MCRKNWIPAAAVIGFGVGILIGATFESSLLTLAVGMAAISGGIWLLRGRC